MQKTSTKCNLLSYSTWTSIKAIPYHPFPPSVSFSSYDQFHLQQSVFKSTHRVLDHHQQVLAFLSAVSYWSWWMDWQGLHRLHGSVQMGILSQAVEMWRWEIQWREAPLPLMCWHSVQYGHHIQESIPVRRPLILLHWLLHISRGNPIPLSLQVQRIIYPSICRHPYIPDLSYLCEWNFCEKLEWMQ